VQILSLENRLRSPAAARRLLSTLGYQPHPQTVNRIMIGRRRCFRACSGKDTVISVRGELKTAVERMNEENLANRMDGILAERLREVPAKNPGSLREAVHWAIRWIRDRPGEKRGVRPNFSCQEETIARIRSLPAHVQEPLRRYFVFREAKESICASIGATPSEFRRFLRDSADYILMQEERMPELEQKQPPGRMSSDRNNLRYKR
jgi:hypothetical protein